MVVVLFLEGSLKCIGTIERETIYSVEPEKHALYYTVSLYLRGSSNRGSCVPVNN